METELEIFEKFDDMNLTEDLLRGIYGYGFERPSRIQQMAIVPFKDKRNIIAQAQSGTGKTGSFAVGILSRLDLKRNDCQAIILAPTHELAYQSAKVLMEIGQTMKIRSHVCVGGTDWREDIKILKKGVDVIIGTPGRVYDMLKRDAIQGDKVEMLILDEADIMLNREGFKDIVHDIILELNKNIQIGLFSATMPPELHELAEKYLTQPLRITVRNEELTLEGIRQFRIDLEDHDKFETLCDLYKDFSITTSIIFCHSRRRAEILTQDLKDKDFAATAIHGSLTSEERHGIMNDFRAGKIRVLVSTDLLARGIDVQHVSIVINYDLPNKIESYIHRIGRSGRFGRKGVAITFVTPSESDNIKELESFYNTQVEHLPRNFNIYI